MKTITVGLAHNRGYPVLVGGDALTRAAHYAADVNALITNPTIGDLYTTPLLAALESAGKKAVMLTVPDGEEHKNLTTLERLLDEMVAASLGRDGGVIALGGGVICDLAGFAAAVYMRGIPVLQIPTTLLAQVDAAIGGKTGVNHPRGKNLLGAFHQPCAVIADTAVLASLPPREYRAGLAEIVKYGLLGDADFFAFLEQQHDAIRRRAPDILEQLICTSVQTKAAIVAADETEQSGRRALLNLGHTFAHAIETISGYGVYLHGEAVAIGLVMAARLSQQVSGFSAADNDRLAALLTALDLPTRLTGSITAAELLTAMTVDKKNVAGHKRFILLRRIGDAYLDSATDAQVMTILEDML